MHILISAYIYWYENPAFWFKPVLFVVVFGEHNSIFKNSLLTAEVFFFFCKKTEHDLERHLNKHLVLAYVLENILGTVYGLFNSLLFA